MSNKGPVIIYNRVPLYLKMVIITILIGTLVWIVSDNIQTRTLKKIFLTQMSEKIKQKAKENLRLFTAYLNRYKDASRIIVEMATLREYLNEKKDSEWSNETSIEVKYHHEIPPWLPGPMVLRSLAHFPYAVLMDSAQRVREVYSGEGYEVHHALREPTNRLLNLSQGQLLLTILDGVPYLIRSEPVRDRIGKSLALLMIASPIDTDFLIASQGHIRSDNLVALTEGENSRVVMSSHPHLIPAGTTLKEFEDAYLVSEWFFQMGATEVQMKIASFIDKEEYRPFVKSILDKERMLRAAGAAVLIFSFVLIMIWITVNIRRLATRVKEFSRETLGIRQDEQRGDEIFILKERFHHLTEEIKRSNSEMQHNAEILKLERDRAHKYLKELRAFLKISYHDLLEPLRKIMFFGNALRIKYSDRLDPRGMDYISRMNSAATRMQQLIHDLQIFSRLTKNTKTFTHIDLNKLVSQLMRDMTPRVAPSGARIECTELPVVEADPAHMRLLVENLIDNSIKFARSDVPPCIKISGEVVHPGHPDNTNTILRMTVEDNGIGFDQQYEDRIFDIFQRLHNRDEYSGTGMGLSICRKITEQHGGSIKAESRPGEGARFIVTIPLKQRGETPDELPG